jgi:hypothetical protein
MRFAQGKSSLRIDVAEKLAEYFGLKNLQQERKRLIDANSFADLAATVQPNPERFDFVSRDEAGKGTAEK